MADNSKLSDLNLTQDEIKRFGDAFKDEKFRELFREYAEEISDPENRRRYEEEIAQLERERGMDVTFIKPEPGYVLKTSVDGETKAFINISKCDKIDKPSSKRERGPDGKNGLMWQIPHSFAPPREDIDKAKKRCKVFDFVIHPDTYRMAESNARFKKMVEDTALDGIERQFGVQLDRKNIKQPKMTFKGVPQAALKRSRNAEGPQKVPDESGILQNMPYPYDDKTSAEKANERDEAYEREQKKKKENAAKRKSTVEPNNNKDGEATVPKYSITHRSEIDMQEYRNARDARPSTRPKELVIKIELPLLKSAAQANLDIFERKLLLESKTPAAYKLDLPLPFPVNEAEGSAKFDKQKCVLTVTLPVLPGETPKLPEGIDGDVDTTTESENPTQKPLIEVISNGTVDHEDQNGNFEMTDETSPPSATVNRNKHFTPQVTYTLPEFTFTQDAETVSFVLKVKNAAEDSLKKMFPSPTVVQLQCISRGSGGFPIHYSLCLQFAEGCKIAMDHCSVDVTAENMVLLLLKDRSSRGLWDCFWAGIDLSQLKAHLFLTPSNLQQQLEELDIAAAEKEQAGGMGDTPSGTTNDTATHSLLVTRMDEKKLTIQISSTKKADGDAGTDMQDEEDDEYDPPSSAEIEVIHSQPPPNLHGILKQHTISESSDDVNIDLESPRSGIETEDELSSSFKRRSVSFSEHIDKATFKTTASVTSMKTVLKSKRRRQRKWEEREKKMSSRRRHNSTGSEGSGDDHSANMSDSQEDMANEDDTETQNGDGELVGADGADSGDVLDFRTNPSGDKTQQNGKGRGKKHGQKEGSIQSGSSEDDSDQNQRTSAGGDENISPEMAHSSESITEESKSKGAENKMSASQSEDAGSKNNKEGSNPIPHFTEMTEGNSDTSTEPNPSSETTNEIDADEAKTESEPSDSAAAVSKSSNQDSNPNASGDKDVAAEVMAKLAAGADKGNEDDSDDDWHDAVEGSTAEDKSIVEKAAGDKPQAGQGKESPPKTMLSWKEGPHGDENNEHRTACAFTFNNAVMFDLDNE